MLRLPVIASLVAVVLCPTPARSDAPPDLVEHVFGATNIAALTGHGRMSIGVSKEGDLTVLAWPSPVYADQLGYINSNDADTREQHRFGAPPSAGAFFGLVVETMDGQETTWLHDEDTWLVDAQSYGPSDGPNPHTTLVSERLGLTVTIIDAIKPEPHQGADVLVRSVSVVRDASSPVQSGWLLSYANLSPLPDNSIVPEFPLIDWALDGRNDFAALWDEDASAIVHFHPRTQRVTTELLEVLLPPEVDWGPIGGALADGTPTDQQVGELLAGLETAYGEGAYLAMTTVPPPDQHQIGYDATNFCGMQDELLDNLITLGGEYPDFLPFDSKVMDLLRCGPGDGPVHIEEGWAHLAESAHADASDGSLSGTSIAAGEVDEALRTPLTFTDDEATAALVISAGLDADVARAGLSVDTEQVAAEAEQALQSWLSELRVPEAGSPRAQRVARRSLINLRIGTEAESGAIVASIARQPPYYLDWPRDGAFFNVMLDASGQSGLVRRRAALYASWQRAEPVAANPLINPDPPTPPPGSDFPTSEYAADAWEMNYFSNGLPGGHLKFEIDTAAFAVWTIVAHVGWEDEPTAYLQEHWDTIRRGADLLAEWRDPETGLHHPAQEDDNGAYTQTLHGAITVYGALDLSARAARLLGEDEAASRWEGRLEELQGAIFTHMYDEDTGLFISIPASDVNPGSKASGPTGWLAWPMRLLPYDDERLLTQVRADIEGIAPYVFLETEGGAYYMKNTVAGSVVFGSGTEEHDDLETMRDTLADQTTPTDHFGEVTVVLGEGDAARADQRVSTPHLWEGALFYLTALALEDPDALTRYEDVLPPSHLDPEPDGETDGGGDTTSGPDDDPSTTSGEPPGGTSDTDGASPDADADADGCGCTSPERPTQTWWLAMIGAIVLRRRRGC